MSGFFTILIDENDTGVRIDSLIASRISGCSRSFAANLINQGKIKVGDQIKKPAYRLRMGDRINGHIPPPEAVSFEPEPITLNILFEDRDIIVINKEPGLVVHPAPGHYSGTLVNALLYHCPDLKGIGGELRPGIVHRLDKDTSGVLVAAKNAPALNELASQFKSRTIKKKYIALVHGCIKTDSGRIYLPIGRHPNDRKKMSTVSRTGRPAETLWKVKQRLPETTLLDIDLKTGRTHQIRVHFSAVHHPLVGDPVYCGKAGKNHSSSVLSILNPLTRQMLHAWKMRLKHPVSGKSMEFEAPVPSDMNDVINALTIIREKYIQKQAT